MMIPVLGVPVTAQSIGPMLAGGIIGSKRGSLAVVLFLACVAVGLPLLAGGRGGLSVFFGPGGGFLIGWIATAFVTGWLIERRAMQVRFIYALICCILGGVVTLYPGGILWIAIVTSLPLSKAFIGAMIFLIGDLVKAGLAALIVVKVNQYHLVSHEV